MSYIKARHILPVELLEKVQEYVNGESIYIPKAADNKHAWGDNTSIRKELMIRNKQIYADYLEGQNTDSLSQKYFLSLKSIQRIIRQQKECDNG